MMKRRFYVSTAQFILGLRSFLSFRSVLAVIGALFSPFFFLLRTLASNSCKSFSLRFVALREGLLEYDKLVLYDHSTRSYYKLLQPLIVFAVV
jgi:hypothetical protein